MNKKIVFLTTSYLIGVAADLFAAILLVFPEVSKMMFGLQNIDLNENYLYASRIAASLMIGWTLLLLWGSFRPVERKGILFLTVFPVVTGLVISSILAVVSGFIKIEYMLPLFIFYAIIIPLYLIAYRIAGKMSATS